MPFSIAFDTPAIVLANARDSYLRERPGFSAAGWANAARYCLQAGVNLEEGLAWAERSVKMGPSFSNLNLQAALLDKLGRRDEALAARTAALPLATDGTFASPLGAVRVSAETPAPTITSRRVSPARRTASSCIAPRNPSQVRIALEATGGA